mgnify:CR=1 FL=1
MDAVAGSSATGNVGIRQRMHKSNCPNLCEERHSHCDEAFMPGALTGPVGLAKAAVRG